MNMKIKEVRLSIDCRFDFLDVVSSISCMTAGIYGYIYEYILYDSKKRRLTRK